MGNGGVIREGDIQVMSAGTGVFHSEYNADNEEPVNFFQIWVFPNKKGVEPRYEQKTLNFLQHKNVLTEIVIPHPSAHALWIYQDAWFNIGTFDKDVAIDYKLKNKNHGVFAMVIQGDFEISGIVLEKRDGLGIWDTESINVKSLSEQTCILLIEIPMYQ
jgi:redox-sensitive bicupin YhaK (pirin superfamily)